MIFDPIIARATPIGNGALAIIRLSGNDLNKIVSKNCKLFSKKNFDELLSNSIHYGEIFDNKNELIDQVLFLIMHAPKTFTGENTIEITCHNNEFIINKIIEIICENGARVANPGEFTQRAVNNKKIDILQAEAIHELITASNIDLVKIALSQLKGSLSNEINNIDEELCKIAAWCGANFEFLEEDRDFSIIIKNMILNLINKIKSILENNDKKKIIKDGIKICLLGGVNAGKSSLFNKLIKKDRAIVTKIPGTTRDLIEYSIFMNNLNITFIDTAGIRKTKDVIEKEGIKRSLIEAKKSDLIFLVYDCSSNLNEKEFLFYKKILKNYSEKILFIINKSEKIKNLEKFEKQNELINFTIKNKINYKFVSVLKENGIDEILNWMKIKISKLEKDLKLPYLLNKRHIESLEFCLKQLNKIEKMINKNSFYEIILSEIHSIQENLSQLTGKSISEKSMNKVFSEFCVGK